MTTLAIPQLPRNSHANLRGPKGPPFWLPWPEGHGARALTPASPEGATHHASRQTTND